MSEIELKIIVNDKKLPTNEFVKTIFWETLTGMVRSLKGADSEIEKIEISASKE